MILNQKFLALTLVGDIVCGTLVTIIGFLIHYGGLQGGRIFSSLVPVLAAWWLIAPWMGNYDPSVTRRPEYAWRAGLAAFLSAPLAAWLRGIWLNSAILPVFIAVLAFTNALGFMIWRVLLGFYLRRVGQNG